MEAVIRTGSTGPAARVVAVVMVVKVSVVKGADAEAVFEADGDCQTGQRLCTLGD